MKKYIYILIFVPFFLAIFYLVYNFYFKTEQGEMIIQKKQTVENLEFLEKLFLNNDEIITFLNDKEEFLRGFWYLWNGPNGEEEVRFFSPKALAESGLSEEEIKKLFEEILEFEIIKKDDIKILIKPEDLPEGLAFNNEIYSSNIEEYSSIKKFLEEKKDKNASDWKKLSKIYNIEGLFNKRDEADKIACRLNNKYCNKIEINVSGTVIDQTGSIISDVKINILSKIDKVENTNNEGKFDFNIEIFELEDLKFQFEKLGFTSSIHSIKVFSKEKKEYNIGNIILSNKSAQISEINLKDKMILSGSAEFDKDKKNILIQTEISKYTIPVNGFWDGDNKFNDVVKIVTFEFNQNNLVPNSFLNIDTFGDGISEGLAGTFMVSFGMPYMEFFNKNGKRIFLKKENPAKLETKIQNYDNIIKNVGKEKIDLMILKSKENGVSLSSKYLLDNFITHPPFWILDQKRGVWDNVPFALLNLNGELETIYYTLKN